MRILMPAKGLNRMIILSTRVKPSHQTLINFSTNTKNPADININNPAANTEKPAEKLTTKQMFKKYGPVAVGVYTTLSFTLFLGIFSTITFMGITAKDVGEIINKLKQLSPLHKHSEDEEALKQEKKEIQKQAENVGSGWIENPAILNVLSNALLAMGITKVFSPLKLLITGMITPSVAKRIARFRK